MFNTICLMDNFLTKLECSSLIKDFKTNKKQIKKYYNTYTLEYVHQAIIDRLSEISLFDFKNYDRLEIVFRKKDSFMDSHIDKGDKMTFIIYLNDDYKGGETIIEDIKIKPKTGRLIFFNNGFYYHSVNKIKDKERYVYMGWYK